MMTIPRHEALTWFRRGFQAGAASQARSAERACYERSVAEFRAQHEADRQAALGSLMLDLVDVLSRALLEDDREWQAGLAAAKAYAAERGHLRVPRHYVTAAGYRLGAWVCTQQQRQRKGTITACQASILDGLGIAWSSPRRRAARPQVSSFPPAAGAVPDANPGRAA